MKIFSSLYVRLAIAILMLFSLLGAALLYISVQSSERYALETTQQVNREIAKHAVKEMSLIKNGQVQQVALKDLAKHVMMINPIVEVYLLSPSGEILSHDLPADTVHLNKVDMQPVKNFIANQTLPIFGDDPRNPEQKQVFSVSAIHEDGKVSGYLYTILNGRQFSDIKTALDDSHNLRVGSIGMLGSILIAGLVGLLLFVLTTRRLQKLNSAVREYRNNSFQSYGLQAPRKNHVDEIDELSSAIYAMTERIENQFNALQESDNTRRELIANVSHDLRTPLTSLQGYLETLLVKKEGLDDSQRDEFINIAHKQSRKLGNLVNELFELVKLETSDMKLNWEEFSLVELIQDLMHDHELQANQARITLELETNTKNPMVYADIGLVHRALENLLQNALRHSSTRDMVTFRIHDSEQGVRVAVADTGEGIAAHEIPHIFKRFYQPESERNQTGNGLGLAIVKRIVELHQSEISVTSVLNKGSQFAFNLPTSAPDNYPDPIAFSLASA